MTYRPGDHWLIDDRTEQQIRYSEAVVEERTGFVVRRGTADPVHPLEERRRERTRLSPTVVRPEPADVFVDGFLYDAFLMEGFDLESFQVS